MTAAHTTVAGRAQYSWGSYPPHRVVHMIAARIVTGCRADNQTEVVYTVAGMAVECRMNEQMAVETDIPPLHAGHMP